MISIGGRQFCTQIIGQHEFLFHGTNCAGDFETIDGPAWFGRNRHVANRWAGWRAPPSGRALAACRVIIYRTTRSLGLIDTVDEHDWHALCEAVCGDPDAVIKEVALEMLRKGLPGWYGREEVMLSRPMDHVVYVCERDVSPVSTVSERN